MDEDNRRLGDPGSAAFRLDRYSFYRLNRVVGRYNRIIEAELKTISLSIPTWRVLMVLGENSPRSIGELSGATIIPLSTLTRVAQRMAAAGLVALSPRPDDARVTEAALTAKGNKRLAAARQVTAPIYARVIEGFSAGQFDQLLDMLDRLERNLGPAS